MNKDIWVIDDDLGILEVVKIILEEHGFLVTTIDDCTLIKKKLTKKMPDLILLDILMKGADGKTIAKDLKSNKKTRHIPVIMVSADHKAEVKMQEAGADDLLKKPFNIDDLINIVKKYTSDKKIPIKSFCN